MIAKRISWFKMVDIESIFTFSHLVYYTWTTMACRPYASHCLLTCYLQYWSAQGFVCVESTVASWLKHQNWGISKGLHGPQNLKSSLLPFKRKWEGGGLLKDVSEGKGSCYWAWQLEFEPWTDMVEGTTIWHPQAVLCLTLWQCLRACMRVPTHPHTNKQINKV